ncbi:MotA/TolQ/ExbB proton channel family protein [Amphritea pacifica]|uniref:MotA/TolQ/ExbB proton channel family protein n=1 Tax=Amphritea pacifica TaxID=2811233 RepID=UPI0019631357|nr:MotA/TolQ/ExbB proton channel family protein [Amphritea pacifica]MBN1007042.1 MotA/TolQ/ExbB proton channel family protein [Amphritea pacifica]
MLWIEKGGPVIWILIAYSVLGLTIIASRYLQLLCTRRSDLTVSPQRWHVGAEKRIVDQLRSVLRLQGHSPELRATAAHLIQAEMKPFESGLKTVAVLANTAPLLGLLGTITGMIKAFQVIEDAGGKVDAMALAGGIWEAMLTTGVGLSVAIPLLILLHFLESALGRYHWHLHQAAVLVLNRSESVDIAGDEELEEWESVADVL